MRMLGYEHNGQERRRFINPSKLSLKAVLRNQLQQVQVI